MTPFMKCADVIHAFNTTTDREYWKAYAGGSRMNPTVVFKSRSSMIELTYYETTNAFGVTFTRTSCSFGDFSGAIHRALTTVCAALKASGVPVACPLTPDDGVVRLQYDPKTKQTLVSLSGLEDDWITYAPAAVKNISVQDKKVFDTENTPA